MYKAHINETTKEVQTVKQHSENTAKLCFEFAIPQMKEVLYEMGLLHDIGKYQELFQKRINGSSVKVEHSTCGAIDAMKKYNSAVGLMMAYCIAGHHTGIPDGTGESGCGNLDERLMRKFEDYGAYKDELKDIDINERSFNEFILRDCENRKDELIDKFAFLTRYAFSCLTDADSIDTSQFCTENTNRTLWADFEKCLEGVKERRKSFVCTTSLQKARASLQNQALDKVNSDGEIFLMNMPTGSGKTLCSIEFALERAIRNNKKRIIYVIPYNSIIDQTAEVFEKIFGNYAEILRHQSTFSYDDCDGYDEDYRNTVKLAAENWDAQLIITTAVQFFESVYANKRGKLRKLHNMADSILIFDEAHLMPTNYLQPCLKSISYITRILNSEAIFLTATMPDFNRLLSRYTVTGSKVEVLIEDTGLFGLFDKCQYENLGEINEYKLIAKARTYPSCLIVVNKRSAARELYKICEGKKYHLSTYMTGVDRKRVINEIKKELALLEKDYPDFEDIPEGRKITVISTSLIEAGVDLDFFTVFRELSGLDSIIQSAGRCNREGKRENAEVFIFTLENEGSRRSADERANLTKGIIDQFDKISCQESIKAYYDRLFFIRDGDIKKNTLSNHCSGIKAIAFKTYGEEFEIIESNTISIVAVRDEASAALVDKLKITGVGNASNFQKYAFSVYSYEFNDLIKQHVVDDFGSGIWCLTNPDYYDINIGVIFEAKDYII